MKTYEVTEVKAVVLFPELKSAGSSYIPRQLLFRNGTVQLKGRWSAERVKSYCKMHARKAMPLVNWISNTATWTVRAIISPLR
jgi:hypothetical protein|nr:MAG TPA: hypothetical protein [Herelleviridae sp.]